MIQNLIVSFKLRSLFYEQGQPVIEL